jgi:4-amino-4-deoxy-L-arabinose transferase-like glycosyltransferase
MKFERSKRYSFFFAVISLVIVAATLFTIMSNSSSGLSFVLVAAACYPLLIWFVEEQSIEVTDNEIILGYAYGATKTINVRSLAKGVYKQTVLGREQNWRLCYDDEDCINIVGNKLFTRDQRRNISKAIYQVLSAHEVNIQGPKRSLDEFK